MQWAKTVSPRQRTELRALGLPDLRVYDDNLAEIEFVQIGSEQFAPSQDERRRIFLAGHRRWCGKTVADHTRVRGTVKSIRVRGTYSLFQSGIKPSDHANIFEVYVVWKNGSRPASWVGVKGLRRINGSTAYP